MRTRLPLRAPSDPASRTTRETARLALWLAGAMGVAVLLMAMLVVVLLAVGLPLASR
jgi:hypothetical protein